MIIWLIILSIVSIFSLYISVVTFCMYLYMEKEKSIKSIPKRRIGFNTF
jgi:hypothetical protein